MDPDSTQSGRTLAGQAVAAEVRGRILGSAGVRSIGGFDVYTTRGDVLPADLADILADARNQKADFVYGDSLHFGPDSDSYFHQLRPGWSPERLRSHCYVGTVVAVDAEVSSAAGGVRFLSHLSPHDRALRLAEKSHRHLHVQKLLYASGAKARFPGADLDAVREHCVREGIDAECSLSEAGNSVRVRREIARQPRISAIVPTRGTTAEVFGSTRVMVVEAVQGMLNRLTYPNLDVVVVADSVTPQSVLNELRAVGGERLKIIMFDEEFNFSRKINLGAVHTDAEFLLLANDDIEFRSLDLVEELLSYFSDPEVGLVGPKLLFEDGTVQSAGHLLNPIPFDLYRGLNPSLPGGYGILGVTREVSSVLAAVALTRREDFMAVGGLSPRFGGDYNDVDYALKLALKGKRTLFTPHVECVHFESQTRRAQFDPPSIALLGHRWQHVLDDDPYSNPYLQPYEFIWKSNVETRESLNDAIGAETEWIDEEWKYWYSREDRHLHRTRYYPKWLRIGKSR